MSNHNLQFQRPVPVRLWPWVLAGLIVALCLWAYLEPMPEFTTGTTDVGPKSPLYGPLK